MELVLGSSGPSREEVELLALDASRLRAERKRVRNAAPTAVQGIAPGGAVLWALD